MLLCDSEVLIEVLVDVLSDIDVDVFALDASLTLVDVEPLNDVLALFEPLALDELEVESNCE